MLAWLRHGWELARNARQQSRRPLKFLSHFYRSKRNCRSVKFASKRSMSVYRGFPSRCTLNYDRISRARCKEKGQKTPDCRFNYRKKKTSTKLKCKFCFEFQHSFADKFSVSWAFFVHEQRVSSRLPLSVLSDIIISRNEQFLFYLFHFQCISFVSKK